MRGLSEPAGFLYAARPGALEQESPTAFWKRGLKCSLPITMRKRWPSRWPASGHPIGRVGAPYQQGEPTSIERLLSRVWDWGEPDGVSIVAGIHPGPVPVGQVDAEVWNDVHGVNVRGALLLISGVLPRMCARGRGSLVAVGSVAGIRPKANNSIYASSKAALGAVLKSCSQEAAAFGVRVNAILPGVIDTPLLRSQLKDVAQMDQISRMIPVLRIGQASEVADHGHVPVIG